MTYIIAEIGQNHNGSYDLAKELIRSASEAGCDAVKFTLRDIGNEMTREMMKMPYTGKHSYGTDYLSHRRELEFRSCHIKSLADYARSIGLDFVLTICSYTWLEDRYLVDKILPIVKYIKVASRDVTNTLLLERLKGINCPLIISSGLSSFSELNKSLIILHKKDLTIMHCISKYPTPNEDAHLYKINELKNLYQGKFKVGYSDHTIGTRCAVMAVGMGATMIEKHITLNKRGKGTDHKCSLEPNELFDFVSEIRAAKEAIGDVNSFERLDLSSSRRKLMRSVCTRIPLKKGDRIKPGDLTLLSPGDGVNGTRISEFYGKALNKDMPFQTKITFDDIH